MRLARYTTVLALGAAVLVGCTDDTTPTVTVGGPTLRLEATGPCNGANIVPLTEDAVVVGGGPINDVAQLVATGIDPSSSTGDLEPGTRVVFEVVDPEDEEDRLRAGFGGFVSTRGQEIPGEPVTSGDIIVEGRTARAQFYCSIPGVVQIRARVESYAPASGAAAAPLQSGTFPIRCRDRQTYETECAGLMVDGDVVSEMGVPNDMGMADAATDSTINPTPSEISIRFMPPANPEDLVIGIRGTGLGRADSVLLSFRVTRLDEPVPDKLVRFRLPDNRLPQVEISPREVTTNQNGVAQVRLRAGGTPGVVTVLASTAPEIGNEQVEDRSAPIIVRGGVPAAGAMSLTCEFPILPAFTARLDANNWVFNAGTTSTTECTLDLADRVEGIVDEGTVAFFLTEAGLITQDAVADSDGVITIEHRTGPPAPYNTTPLPYEAGAGYGGTFNPRDGVVRLVAVTVGEKDFVDTNGNKFFDPGVDFVGPDQDFGEPFVDANDNGRYDYDELGGLIEEFRDTDQDGAWTPPTYEWSGAAEIWTSTVVLWVGSPYVPVDAEDPTFPVRFYCLGGNDCSTNPTAFRDDCPRSSFYLGSNGVIVVENRFADRNGNCVDANEEGLSYVEADGPVVIDRPPQPYETGCFVFTEEDGSVLLRENPITGEDEPHVGLFNRELPLRPVHVYQVIAGEAGDSPAVARFAVGVQYDEAGGDTLRREITYSVCY
ncbi:MAG: hypothetical protein H6703_01130 [Myxococcales bacterium]|nr:hypothetical protein [Myxococcales bacterium]MCB9541035.1 hypothetical protein [Myxococcales bacterium]MCB9554144.1 hypothetical protein [Myxococcales bacterium]